MSRKRLEEAGPPGSSARLRVELVAADRFISFVTWGVAAGMIVWSILNATPYVRAHLAPEWQDTAFVLPLVVDLAFLGSLRADEIASRHNVSGGVWAGLLRLFTGAGSVFLNIGHAAEKGDWTGVCQHLITPGILVLLAEAGPVYRRRLAGRLDDVERAEADKAEAARKVAAAEEDRRRRIAQEEADRQADRERQEQERLREQRWEDEERRAALEEKQEAARAARQLDARRLDLEEKRLDAPAPAPRPQPAPAAPPAPKAAPAPAPAAVAATRPVPPRVSARVDAHERPAAPPPAPAAAAGPEHHGGPVKDWDLPGLPEDCAPGRAPELLTSAQVSARIDYGLDKGWTQRRIGEFAGRSATVVNRRSRERERAA